MGYEGISIRESQGVPEWMAMGEINGGIESLLRLLTMRFGPGMPVDLEDAIRATSSEIQLRSWFELALKMTTLEAFRQAAGL